MYALKYFDEPTGKPLWLAGMSAIGPYTTVDPSEALTFETEEDARRHPANLDPLAFYDVVPAPAA